MARRSPGIRRRSPRCRPRRDPNSAPPRRDFLVAWSYRLSFVTDWVSMMRAGHRLQLRRQDRAWTPCRTSVDRRPRTWSTWRWGSRSVRSWQSASAVSTPSSGRNSSRGPSSPCCSHKPPTPRSDGLGRVRPGVRAGAHLHLPGTDDGSSAPPSTGAGWVPPSRSCWCSSRSCGASVSSPAWTLLQAGHRRDRDHHDLRRDRCRHVLPDDRPAGVGAGDLPLQPGYDRAAGRARGPCWERGMGGDPAGHRYLIPCAIVSWPSASSPSGGRCSASNAEAHAEPVLTVRHLTRETRKRPRRPREGHERKDGDDRPSAVIRRSAGHVPAARRRAGGVVLHLDTSLYHGVNEIGAAIGRAVRGGMPFAEHVTALRARGRAAGGPRGRRRGVRVRAEGARADPAGSPDDEGWWPRLPSRRPPSRAARPAPSAMGEGRASSPDRGRIAQSPRADPLAAAKRRWRRAHRVAPARGTGVRRGPAALGHQHAGSQPRAARRIRGTNENDDEAFERFLRPDPVIRARRAERSRHTCCSSR